MIKKEQNLVVEKTHQRVQSVDVDQLVQPVKITKEEVENLRKEKQELFQEKKTKVYMGGLKGEDNYELGNYIKRNGLP